MKFFLRFFCVISCFFLLNSCKSSRQKADLIVTNAKVYTVDTAFSVTEAFAVKDGKIIETGTSQFISETFDADTVIDAQGKIIFPGFIDAHCHFYNYGMGLNEVNLVGTNSFEEVLERVKNFSASHPAVKNDPRSEWIIGRGWDQNDWKNNQFPDRAKLDELFPDRPVLLTRIDGHAALANKTALKRAGIHYGSSIGGGKIEFRENFDQEDWSDPLMKVETGKLNFRGKSPSGILIDNAVKLVEDLIPMPSREAKEKALMAAQRDCFENGLTTIDDAGLDKEIILLIDSLQKAGQLQMRIYAMISSTQNNFDYFLHRPKIKTQYLNVRSFKFYADGALGSRGACLKEDYQDKKNWKGFLLQQAEYFRLHAAKMFENGFQMNTHCIGDSSDYVIGTIYRNQINPTGKDEDALKKYRWRTEHAQIRSEEHTSELQSH